MAEAKIKTVQGGMVNENIKMTGKTVLITGANTGMGLATAIDMGKRGARVIMTSRNMDRGNEAKDTAVKESGSENIIVKQLDLSSMESIRVFADDINKTESKLDVLINNAGVMMCPQSKTKDGFEMQFGVNHLGHFLLTNLLLDLIKKSAPSRIVTVSSAAHYKYLGAAIHWDDLNLEKNYTPTTAYAQSKLMNVLFSRELSKRLEGTGVTSNSLEPGAVKTDLQRHVGTHENPTFMDRIMGWANSLTRRWWRTPEQGAQTQIYCAVAPELEGVTGKFFANCKQTGESNDAKRDDFAKRLWDISEEYTGLKQKSEEQQKTESPNGGEVPKADDCEVAQKET
ncbi:retinol dehydrogenase 14-like [Styela clava]